MKKLTLGVGAVLALMLVLAAGAFTVQAAPATPTPEPIQPSFHDGRVNAYDPGAPVAIFETHKSVPIVNDNGVPTTADVVNGVQLLYWDGTAAKEVMNVSADTIDTAINRFTGVKSNTAANSTSNTTMNSTSANSTNNTSSTATSSNATATANSTGAASSSKLTTVNNGNSVVISQKNGYTLYYSKDGYLWITTPANFEGKVYTFSWQKDF